jgi:hypothetical protein
MWLSRPVSNRPARWSVGKIFVFWWGLLFIVQQAERLFLLYRTLAVESPSMETLVRTWMTGLQGDAIVATGGILVAVVLAGVTALALRWTVGRSRRDITTGSLYAGALTAWASALAVMLAIALTVDMGYYLYNKQHLDFVFFEYVDDLLGQLHDKRGEQAVGETAAEIGDQQRWGMQLIKLYLYVGAAVVLWYAVFVRYLAPLLSRWRAASPIVTALALIVFVVAAAAGFHPKGPYAIRLAPISSSAYYTLAQNPILYAIEAFRAMLQARFKETSRMKAGRGLDDDWFAIGDAAYDLEAGRQSTERISMSVNEALTIARSLIGPESAYPFPRYPIVRKNAAASNGYAARHFNVLLVFVEALDRRYVGRTITLPGCSAAVTVASSDPDPCRNIRLTPFLDRLKADSVYFENFFANGAQTARGLLATFCSYYPRRGPAAMKTRYAHDFLCLPSLLRNAGYRTEMVIGTQRDIDRLHLFMSRNGLDELFDESDFPPGTSRVGSGSSIGKPDGVLFDMIRTRLATLQTSGRPFFLSTKTITMHHPFAVPGDHPEVLALKSAPDGYLAALRYFDFEFERFFTDALREGLLKDTVVLILGDHGRHEPVGKTDAEKEVGHFLTPLFVWMPDSLRTAEGYRPRTVSAVVSQVDIAPTILAMNGLTPKISPFLGRNVSCLLAGNCLPHNFAYMISPYGDELIGLADTQGLLLYSLRKGTVYQTDLELKGPVTRRAPSDPDVADKYRRLQALYLISNVLLDRNRIWSWKDLGPRL